MKWGTLLSALFVIALITFDITLSVAHAKTITTIYKVTKVSSGNKLRLRAWPSSKSRVKVSLPHNAKDITETGKKKIVGNTVWREVRWDNNRGWVNAKYLKKTGVLVKSGEGLASDGKAKSSSRNKRLKSTLKRKISSRNTRSLKSAQMKKPVNLEDAPVEMPPQEFEGDRYDQSIPEMSAREVKTSYGPKNGIKRKLSCVGDTPKSWSMKMSVSGKTMNITLAGKKSLKVPLRYNEWTSNKRVRMSLGGSRGRNMVVDVNLEKTNVCRVGSSNKKYRYEVKTTINNQFYSGCCQ